MTTINTINQQPLAISLQLTDYFGTWQDGQSPSTRKTPVSALGAYYLALTGGTMSGGLTIDADGISVTGDSEITGTLSVSAAFTIASGDLTVTAGDLHVVAGGATISGGATIGGDSAITGDLTVSTPGTSGNQVVNFSQFAATSGGRALPGPVSEQWGSATTNGSGVATVLFSPQFSSALRYLTLGIQGAGSIGCNITANSRSGFDLLTFATTTGNPTAATVFWHAAGV